MPKTRTVARVVRLTSMTQDRLEFLATQERPLQMATHVSYAEIASLVAELFEMRRTFGSVRRELVLPVYLETEGNKENA